MTTKRRAGLLGLILTAWLAVTAAAAHAETYPVETGQLQTDTTSSLTEGSTVVVEGSGFLPGATVTITIESDPIVLATVTADGTGAFSRSVVIPAGLEAGTHTLKATGASPTGTLVLSQTVTVAQTGQTTTGTGVGSGALAFTGRSVATTLLIACALAGTGYGMVVVGRRLRHS